MKGTKILPYGVYPAPGAGGELFWDAETLNREAVPGWESVFDRGFRFEQSNPRRPLPDFIWTHPRAFAVGSRPLADPKMMDLFSRSDVEWRDIECVGRGVMRLAIVRGMWRFDTSILQDPESKACRDLIDGRLIGLNPSDKLVPLQIFSPWEDLFGKILVFDWPSELSFVRLFKMRKYTGLVFD